MPIHDQDTPFFRLLHRPNDPAMIKDVFDNIKNFAICGGMAILTSKINAQNSWYERVSWLFLIFLTTILGLLCFIQAWVLSQKIFYQIFEMSHFELSRKPTRANLKMFLLMSIPILLLMTVIVTARLYLYSP